MITPPASPHADCLQPLATAGSVTPARLQWRSASVIVSPPSRSPAVRRSCSLSLGSTALLHPRPRRQHLLLDAADRQHQAQSAISPVIATSEPTGTPAYRDISATSPAPTRPTGHPSAPARWNSWTCTPTSAVSARRGQRLGVITRSTCARLRRHPRSPCPAGRSSQLLRSLGSAASTYTRRRRPPSTRDLSPRPPAACACERSGRTCPRATRSARSTPTTNGPVGLPPPSCATFLPPGRSSFQLAHARLARLARPQRLRREGRIFRRQPRLLQLSAPGSASRPDLLPSRYPKSAASSDPAAAESG